MLGRKVVQAAAPLHIMFYGLRPDMHQLRPQGPGQALPPEEHHRLRELLTATFTPGAVVELAKADVEL